MAVIMAIGAHIGDMELSAGGMLAMEAAKGNHVVLVSLTAGEKGNPIGVDVAEYRKQKVGEAEKGAALLGGRSIVLDIDDGMLSVDEQTVWKVCDVIRKEKPDVLITHWRQSMHKDHMACHQIVKQARYYAANSGFERELTSHPCSKLFFAENLEDQEEFFPFIYVDITGAFDLWKQVVKVHAFTTQSTDHRYWEYYDALSVCRGAECRFGRAQTFMVRPGFDHVELDSLTRW